MTQITEMAHKRDALMPSQWLNNAAQNFDVIRSYGEANFQKLKSLKDRYDAGKTLLRQSLRQSLRGYKRGV